MSRRKPIPGMLSLLDLPASTPPPVRMVAPEPEPVVQEAEPLPVPGVAPKPETPRIGQPGYMRDGLLELPPGVIRPPSMAYWYCVVHVDGTYRDALAILYRVYNKNDCKVLEDISGVMEVPLLGRCWENQGHWIWDVYAPAMAAMETYAAETLGVSIPEIRSRHYLTLGSREEARPVLRDCGRLNSVIPQHTIKGAA